MRRKRFLIGLAVSLAGAVAIDILILPGLGTLLCILTAGLWVEV